MVEISVMVRIFAAASRFVPWTPFARRNRVGVEALVNRAEKVPMARNISHHQEVGCPFA